MRDVDIAPARRVDPWSFGNRDPVRTPMQWDAEGSFTTVDPWLPFAPDHERVNVAAPRDDPRSLLSLYRNLLALRRAEPDLVTGAYRTLSTGDGVFRFARGDSLEVRIDFGSGAGEILRHGSKLDV